MNPTAMAGMRAQVLARMPDTCTLVTTPQVSDGQGGFTAGTPVRTGPLACGYRPIAGTEGFRSVQLAADATGTVGLPASTTVSATDQIEVTLRSGEILLLEVVFVARRSDELRRLVHVKDVRPV